MAVPRNRSSNARKGSRRAHDMKKTLNFKNCSNCNSLSLSHRICASCGHYNNKPVAQVEAE